MPGFMGHEIRTKLAVIALPERLRLQVACACELLHVVMIAFNIPLQLGGLERFGERGRNRTYNLLIKSQLLCQLSYAPILRVFVGQHPRRLLAFRPMCQPCDEYNAAKLLLSHREFQFITNSRVPVQEVGQTYQRNRDLPPIDAHKLQS
jgi:hypothetical protein